MGVYRMLNERDKEEIKKLLVRIHQLNIVSNKLSVLEFTNNKTSSKYQNYLEYYISLSKSITDDADKLVGDDLKRAELISRYVTKTTNERYMQFDGSNTEIGRMVSIMSKIIKDRVTSNIEYVSSQTEAHNIAATNLYTFMLFIVEKMVESNPNKNDEQTLIILKYSIAMLFPSIEDNLVNNNFDILKGLITDMQNSLNQSSRLVRKIIDSSLLSFIQQTVEVIVEIKKSSSNSAMLLQQEAILRSALAQISESKFLDVSKIVLDVCSKENVDYKFYFYNLGKNTEADRALFNNDKSYSI